MADFYGRTRACIVPLRYGAGVKIKTVEALQYGVPTVSTSVGAEGIDLRGTAALLVADDARQFGLGLVSLLTDRVGVEGHLGLYPGGSRGRSYGPTIAT
jgi:hypothetical protein